MLLTQGIMHSTQSKKDSTEQDDDSDQDHRVDQGKL